MARVLYLKNFINTSWSHKQIFFKEEKRFNQFSTLKNDKAVYNFGKPDDDMIQWKNAYFH